MVYSKIASTLQKILTTSDFKKRTHMEETRAKEDNSFPKGRQIAFMIDDYLKISGSSEAIPDFTDWMKVTLKNDNVQGFDTKAGGCSSIWMKIFRIS